MLDPSVVPSPVTPAGAPAAPLQAGSPLAVAGTVGLFALFLSVTAHIAARNVLGDVPLRKAFAVGPVPAAIGFVAAAFQLNPFLALGLALLADAGLVHYLYGQRATLTAYVTLIHFVVTVILGAVIYGVVALIGSAPG